MENVKQRGEGSKSLHEFKRHLDLFLGKEEIGVHGKQAEKVELS